jgi:protein required for attachment to host cells
MKPIKTLVLLANDAHARLFENYGPGKGLTELEDFAASVLAEADVRYADRPGRSSAAPGMARHAFADQAEAEHDQAQAAFAKAVLTETEARFVEAGCDRFVLVAAPSTLGVLRANLPPKLETALVVDVAKDFVKLKPAEVVTRLSGEIVL